MDTKGRRFLLAVGILGSILAGAGPALAQHGGHPGSVGGGARSGGGSPSGGGASHLGGGARTSAGGAAGGRLSGPGARASVGGGHFGVAPQYAPANRFAGGGIYGRSAPAVTSRGGTYASHGAYGRPSGYYGHGYERHDGYEGRGYYGHGYSTGAYWRGGYWRGGFWPRCYYGLGFSWFLPVLPVVYATYWWGGVPYYYANDVYYTYNPGYEGYVATDPPPVAEGGAADAAASAAPSDGAGDIFMYPKNGQSPEQQATDKAECQRWATEQAGQVARNGSDYQRAMVACLEGRGYSVR